MEEKTNKSILVRPRTGIAAVPTAVNEQSTYFGQVTFTGSNTGSWHSLPSGATQARLCVAFKPLDNIEFATQLMVSAYQYPDLFRCRRYFNDINQTPDADGYYFHVTDYFSITPNDMRIIYAATSLGSGFAQDRKVSVHLWVDTK